MDENNRVELVVTPPSGGQGVSFGAWLNVKVQHSIEQLAGVFSMDVANSQDAWRIQAGSACEVWVGRDLLITGFVDSKTVRHNARSTTINVQGRDKTGDLVDCSAAPKEWAGLQFEEVAKQLLAPHKIELYTQLETGQAGYRPKKAGKAKAPVSKAGAGGGTLPKKATNTGDTVHKVLEKLCKIQACLMVSDRKGGLIITRAGLAGQAHDSIVFNENLISFEHTENFANLFSEITVKGQQSGAQTLSLATVTDGRVKPAATVARSKDVSVSGAIARYRPLILQAEEQADASRCTRRAQWEAGNREAKSKKVVAKVQGWRQSNGDLWEVNTLTTIVSPYTPNGAEWLITSINFELSTSGTTAELTLYSPRAYDVLPDIPKPTGTGGRLSLATVKPR